MNALDTPFIVELGGDVTKVSQILGGATNAVLAGRTGTLVLDFGGNAVDPALLGALLRWAKRNETMLRTRTRAMVLVVPRFWHAVQWRLAVLFDTPPVRTVVVRSRARAIDWLRESRSPR